MQYNQSQPDYNLLFKELIAKYDENGELDPIFMANLTQEIFENPTVEKVNLLDKIVEYVQQKKETSSVVLNKPVITKYNNFNLNS